MELTSAGVFGSSALRPIVVDQWQMSEPKIRHSADQVNSILNGWIVGRSGQSGNKPTAAITCRSFIGTPDGSFAPAMCFAAASSEMSCMQQAKGGGSWVDVTVKAWLRLIRGGFKSFCNHHISDCNRFASLPRR